MKYPAGTLDLESVKDSLYDIFKELTEGVIDPESIIWADQSKTLPARPMISLKIIDGPRPVGRDGNIFGDAATKTLTVGMQHVLTVSLQVFGSSIQRRPGALQVAADLNAALTRPSILSKLSHAGIGVQDTGQPRNLTALEESEYEDRAGFEMELGVAQNVVDDPSTIETVNGEGTVNPGDIPVPISITGL